ncbi:hypothetical protein BD779DRAFT_1673882 [Infundibulicybe gibba]|nr:hypothetical protein BD779DRAFT_1673882 [Infundibulicybe gibba]
MLAAVPLHYSTYMTTTSEKLDAAKRAISHKSPYCTGRCPLTAADSALVYLQGTDAKWLNFPTASDGQLELLSDACEPATFGLNQVDVLDESYRKARRMDYEKFFTKFTPEAYNLPDRIRAQLLEGLEQRRTIRAEPYKLNVYRKGSFFKSHKDTPRGSNMFGSLVIIFPTQHEGGAFLLRHRGEEWSFDSAAMISQSNEPCFGYIAFYSDVEHEVSVVHSGYRVSLTYNLYYNNNSLLSSVSPVAPDDAAFKSAISALLDDPSFLPSGGLLGFGLRFMYPIPQTLEVLNFLDLKGCDAMVQRVCEELDLETSLNAIYEVEDIHGTDVQVMTTTVLDLLGGEIDGFLLSTLVEEYDAVPIYPTGTTAPRDENNKPYSTALEVAWISDLTTFTRSSSEYIAYGNEASPGIIYCDISLTACVGEPGRR